MNTKEIKDILHSIENSQDLVTFAKQAKYVLRHPSEHHDTYKALIKYHKCKNSDKPEDKKAKFKLKEQLSNNLPKVEIKEGLKKVEIPK